MNSVVSLYGGMYCVCLLCHKFQVFSLVKSPYLQSKHSQFFCKVTGNNFIANFFMQVTRKKDLKDQKVSRLNWVTILKIHKFRRNYSLQNQTLFFSEIRHSAGSTENHLLKETTKQHNYNLLLSFCSIFIFLLFLPLFSIFLSPLQCFVHNYLKTILNCKQLRDVWPKVTPPLPDPNKLPTTGM